MNALTNKEYTVTVKACVLRGTSIKIRIVDGKVEHIVQNDTSEERWEEEEWTKN